MKKALAIFALALLVGCGGTVVKPPKAAENRRKACMYVAGYHVLWSKTHGCKKREELRKQAQREKHPVVYVCGKQVFVAYPDGRLETKKLAGCN